MPVIPAPLTTTPLNEAKEPIEESGLALLADAAQAAGCDRVQVQQHRPPAGDGCLDLLARHADVPNKIRHYVSADKVPLAGVVPDGWRVWTATG